MRMTKWPLVIFPFFLTGCFSEGPDRAVEACATAMKAIGDLSQNKDKDANLYKPSIEGKKVVFLLKEDKEYVDAACVFEFKRRPEDTDKTFSLSGFVINGNANDLSRAPSQTLYKITKALADGGFDKINPKDTKLSTD